MAGINDFLGGAIATGYAVAGLFFLKFYFRTGERLFVLLCAALWLLGSTRVFMVMARDFSENHWLFIVRLIAYLVILGAIVDKNLSRRWRPHDSAKLPDAALARKDAS
jgi:hypothetical protein